MQFKGQTLKCKNTQRKTIMLNLIKRIFLSSVLWVSHWCWPCDTLSSQQSLHSSAAAVRHINIKIAASSSTRIHRPNNKNGRIKNERWAVWLISPVAPVKGRLRTSVQPRAATNEKEATTSLLEASSSFRVQRFVFSSSHFSSARDDATRWTLFAFNPTSQQQIRAHRGSSELHLGRWFF